MSRVITFIRHAQQISHRNIDPPIIKAPSPLNVPYDIIITSPYLRCRQTSLACSTGYHGQTSLACSTGCHGQTSQSINIDPKPIYVDVRISEYQGHKPKHSRTPMDPMTAIYSPIPLYDETWDECRSRLDQHWEYIKSLKENVLVVTHGVVVNYMHEKIMGKKMYKRGRDVPYANGFTMRI